MVEEPTLPISKKEQSVGTDTEEKKGTFKSKFEKLSQQKTATSSLSINELTKEVEKTDEEIAAEEYTSHARDSYSDEQFQTNWKKLAERIKDSEVEGSSIVYSAMITRAPILSDNFQVELSVDNRSQAEELMDRRTEIHDYLRKQLNNGGVEVKFRIEKDQKKRKAYTDEEKFNKMLESNPTLLRLKNELSLDFI
ncbi:MAG: DNA polymerase-3 subunit gamma/tau [Vicingaceae bacterium]